MNNYWWLVAPYLVDDEYCELCDDLAMPYDENTEYPWCPKHAMQMWCGLGTEDFEINPSTERYWEQRKIQDQIIRHDTICTNSYLGDVCFEEAMPRLKRDRMDSPEICKATANLCTEHAVGFFGENELLDMETWLMECEPGYRASLDEDED